MKYLITTALMTLLLAPAIAQAQSPFDGTWKIDTSKVQAPKKPYTRVLKDGIYTCKTCTPPFSVKADGAFHPVKGYPDFDMEAIKVVDESTIRYTDKKDGKVVGKGTITVSPDGKTLTVDFTSISKGGPITGKSTAVRVTKGPAGSHATSGSWRTQGYSDVSDNLLTTTYRVDGDMLHMSSPTGESYSARMDGSDAPMQDSDSVTSVAVTKLGPRSLREVDKYQGKPVSVATMKVSADGQTMRIVSHNKKAGTTMRLVADKQSGGSDEGGGMASATAPDGGPLSGTYASSRDDQTWTFRFRPDGTYRATENGKAAKTETGSWQAEAGNKVCLHPQDGATRCYRQSKPSANGTWMATRVGRPDDVSTIRRKG